MTRAFGLTSLLLPLFLWISVPQLVAAQTVEQLFEQGHAAVEADQHAEAEQIWRRVIQQQPKNARAYLELGLSLRKQNKLEAAIVAFRQSLALKPDAETYTYLADTLGYGFRKWDDAEVAYRKALSVPDAPVEWALKATDGLADHLARRERQAEAIPLYQQLTQRYPEEPLPYEHWGDFLNEQQRLSDAAIAYRKSIEIAKSRGDFSDLDALPSRMNHFAVFFKLTNVLKGQNLVDEAIAVYRDMIAIDPTNQGAYIELGDLLNQNNRATEAIPIYRHILATTKDTNLAAFIHNDLGLVLQQQGKLREAAQEFKQAMKLLPNYDEAAENLRAVEQQLKK